jgi:hypothetical protein
MGDMSFSGTCDVGPAIVDLYGQVCDPTRPLDCQFDNPLALTPKSAPSVLQCARAPGDRMGTCRLPLMEHGDACNVDMECSSGNCLKDLRMCKGIDEGEACVPYTYPDPCTTSHYCKPDSLNPSRGICSKSISAGKVCSFATACERGFYCTATTNSGVKRCVAPFTVPNGYNTTIAPYMCASASAVVLVKAQYDLDTIYQCVDGNTTLVGYPCNIGDPVPNGYTCTCANDGQTRLVTVDYLGGGMYSQVWRDLYKCLLGSTNIVSAACEFDPQDMSTVRYGSCAYYACYPYYLNLVNVTGGRYFRAPFNSFLPWAQCEIKAAIDYYANLGSQGCLRLPNMENWKCYYLLNPSSFSVSATSGMVAFIMLLVTACYWGHMWIYRVKNNTKIPFLGSKNL